MKRAVIFVFGVLLISGLVSADSLVLQPDATGKDTYIRMDDPTKCFGSAKNIDSGNFWQHSAHRMLLAFDLSAIPHNANITNAYLELFMYNDGPNKEVILDVHRMTRSWNEGTTGYRDNGATWNTYDGVHFWTTPGGDYDATVIDFVVTKTQNQNYSWEVTELVSGWHAGYFDNFGLIIKGADEASDIQKRKRFRSSDHTTAAQRPKLVVEYTLGECVPLTCADLERECGVWDDGCGATVYCGNCSEGYFCDSGVCEIEPLAPVQPTWHIQYNPTPVDPQADVDYWNLDLFDVGQETMWNLKSQGTKVMCYFSAGSWEEWRADAALFPEHCLGASNGWPGERWVDTNCPQVRALMTDRIDLGISKGCDAFDPDNMDAYGNGGGGFSLSSADALEYFTFLADYAHIRGAQIGLKNALEIIPEALDTMDFAVNEQCWKYRECDLLFPVVDQGKPVFHIEYGGQKKADRHCSRFNDYGFSSVIKKKKLHAWEISCLDY